MDMDMNMSSVACSKRGVGRGRARPPPRLLELLGLLARTFSLPLAPRGAQSTELSAESGARSSTRRATNELKAKQSGPV